MPADQYAAIAAFLKRFYGPDKNETESHIAALEAFRPHLGQQMALAREMRDLLADTELTPRDLADFASRATGIFFESPADAREFLQSVYEMNLFNALVEIGSQADPNA
jgi:hypothetical protein